MGSGQSGSAPSPEKEAPATEKDSLASTPKTNRSLEKSYTEKVAPSFVHTVGHELSVEEMGMIRRLVELTSSTPDDTPGTYENKLHAKEASGEAVALAEDIMSRTSYAFNFVVHGQHESGNIRALLEQHKDGGTAASAAEGSAIQHHNTTKLKFDDRKAKDADKKLQARSGMTSLNLAMELRERGKKKPQQVKLEVITSERELGQVGDGEDEEGTDGGGGGGGGGDGGGGGGGGHGAGGAGGDSATAQERKAGYEGKQAEGGADASPGTNTHAAEATAAAPTTPGKDMKRRSSKKRSSSVGSRESKSSAASSPDGATSLSGGASSSSSSSSPPPSSKNKSPTQSGPEMAEQQPELQH